MLVALPCILGFICFMIFTIKCHKQRSIEGVFIKNFASIFFILTAATATYLNPDMWRFGLTVVLGGSIGMLGDIYLDQKWVYPQHNDQYLNIGFISFGIGHFFYIGGMYYQAKFTPKDMIVPIIIGFVVCFVNLLLEKPTKQNYGKFKLIASVYTVVLATMMGTALWAFVKTGQTAYIIYTVGGALFLLSDVILSPMYFAIEQDRNTPVNFVLNHTTYYLAQYLIALTPLLIKA